MGSIIQQIIAISILAAAVIYIVFHYWRKQKTKSGCAACKAMEAVSRPQNSSNIKTGEPESSPLQKQP